jgi:hypothetical protein
MTSFRSELAERPPVLEPARPPATSGLALPAATVVPPRRGFVEELGIYFGRFREFQREDWIVYVAWVGMIFGLVLSSGGFLAFGASHGIRFPAEAWLVPIGALIFTGAIAVDTIGHRTVYKEVLRGAEGLVHHVTIFCGIGSCVLLCAAWRHREALWIPAMILTILSFVYSLVDEVFHWHRYASRQSDRVEMWSHAFILVGHGTMMLGWWRWFALGYPGVDQTAALLAGTP